MPPYINELYDAQATYAQNSGASSAYSFDDGIRVIPVIGLATEAPTLVRVHSPYTTRRTTFNYSKSGSPPLIPPPGRTKTGYNFLSGTIAIDAPKTTQNGDILYNMKGEYFFVAPFHVPSTGAMYYDAHPWFSNVDVLSDASMLNGTQGDPTLNTQYGGYNSDFYSDNYDLYLLSSNRILG